MTIALPPTLAMAPRDATAATAGAAALDQDKVHALSEGSAAVVAHAAVESGEQERARDTQERHALALVELARGAFLEPQAWTQAERVSRYWRVIVHAVVHGARSRLVTHEECARHHVPRRTERPERLRFVLERCRARLPRVPCVDAFAAATPAQLTRFHANAHVDALHQLARKVEKSMAALDELEQQDRAFASPRAAYTNGFQDDARPCSPSSSYYVKRPDKPKSKASYYAQFEYVDLDQDTILMRHSLPASLHAAGGVCHAVDLVLDAAHRRKEAGPDHAADNEDDVRNAFCVVRPPGHHAEPHKAMGFCFFNNVGVAACHALEAHALSRVAIIDFDVHHGNGTQRRAELEPRLLYVSLHQSPHFPHSGFARERGVHDNILNIPLPARTSGAVYRARMRELVWPKVLAFAPELILISAGFDGHASDPLSDMKLQADDFYWLTREIVRMAWATPARGRVVSALEGGYHARALADSAEQHLLALVHGSVAPPRGMRRGHLQ